jgi:hypothetical protein
MAIPRRPKQELPYKLHLGIRESWIKSEDDRDGEYATPRKLHRTILRAFVERYI